ncbi:MAG: phosphoribosyl-ATP diphosphatase [Rhodospirillales bacterium]|jgi:phosphoribosyl-ATP pyrophosphohydrolase|nr:phosphoribosyl-ATP diphosphatase [Rhodospirillales bacterium]
MAMNPTPPNADDVILRLYRTIESRRNADPEVSHTAKLFQKGTKKIAQKVGEEAVEVVIEAIRNNRKRLVDESADLMYHLLVLWADAHIEPHEIWDELSRRAGLSGIAEKASRDPDKDD